MAKRKPFKVALIDDKLYRVITCTQCNETKTTQHFNRNSERVGGYISMCKSCKTNYRTRQAEHIAKQKRDWRFNNLEHCKKKAQIHYFQNCKSHLEHNKRRYLEKVGAYRVPLTEEERAKNSRLYRGVNTVKKALTDQKYYANNKKLISERGAVWREKNRASIVIRKTEYYAKNKDRLNAENRHKYGLNPGVQKAYNHKRRAVLLQRQPAWADIEKLRQVFTNPHPNLEVDHILPLQGISVSGLHIHSNLQYITKSDNAKKGNRTPPELLARVEREMMDWIKANPYR